MRRTIGAAVAAVIAVTGLAVCAPAATAAVVTIGPGNFADVAVDAAGTAYISYKLPRDTTGFCRLPLGATACDVRTELSTPGSDPNDRPQLMRRPSDGALFILDAGADPNGEDVDGKSLWLYASADGGATWTPPRKVSQGVAAPDVATLTADGSAIDILGEEPQNANFQRIRVDGSATGLINLSDPFSANDITIDQALVALPGGSDLAAMSTSDAGGLRFFGGAGNIYDQAAWSPWPGRALPGDESGHVLVTGPRGTYLVAKQWLIDQVRSRQPLVVRRLGSGGFDRGRLAGESGGFTNGTIAAAEDPAGTLHIVYDHVSNQTLRYSRTRGRCWFGKPTTLYHAYASHDGIRGLRIDASSPDRGMAVWNGGDGVVRAVALRGGDRPATRRERRCRA